MQSDYGLTSIVIASAQNTDIFVPSFSSGTLDTVQVTATKIDPAKSSWFNLRVCDPNQCITCDPVVTLVVREAGKPVRETFSDLPQAESNVLVRNGSPGLKNLVISVNGESFRIAGMADGEERRIDISEAMLPGDQNVVTLTGLGAPGGSATVTIHD